MSAAAHRSYTVSYTAVAHTSMMPYAAAIASAYGYLKFASRLDSSAHHPADWRLCTTSTVSGVHMSSASALLILRDGLCSSTDVCDNVVHDSFALIRRSCVCSRSWVGSVGPPSTVQQKGGGSTKHWSSAPVMTATLRERLHTTTAQQTSVKALAARWKPRWLRRASDHSQPRVRWSSMESGARQTRPRSPHVRRQLLLCRHSVARLGPTAVGAVRAISHCPLAMVMLRPQPRQHARSAGVGARHEMTMVAIVPRPMLASAGASGHRYPFVAQPCSDCFALTWVLAPPQVRNHCVQAVQADLELRHLRAPQRP